jgi:hypothetical protein
LEEIGWPQIRLTKGKKKNSRGNSNIFPVPWRKKENLPSRLAGSSRLNSGGALISIWRAEQGRRGDPGEHPHPLSDSSLSRREYFALR